MPATPRDAATLILLRDKGRPGGGVQVLLLQRHAGATFLPGAHVFPGGALEEADFTPEMAALCRGLSPDAAHRIIRDVSPPQKSLGFFVAAIREAFEESGVLLAEAGSGPPALDEGQLSRWRRRRAEVNAASPLFASRLADDGLKLATDQLFYFAHWITPEALPVRFDARFFVAAAPSLQKVSPDGQETVEARWVSPPEAVEEHRRGRLVFAPPTLHSLKELAQFRCVEEVLASTQGKRIQTRYG